MEFRIRGASLSSTGENSRVAFMLLHDYPEGGLDSTREARVMDSAENGGRAPAYQVRIRGGFNRPTRRLTSCMEGVRDIDGEFEKKKKNRRKNPAFWLPGFVSGAGGVVPEPIPTKNYPPLKNGWWMGTSRSLPPPTFKRYPLCHPR